MDIAVAVGYTVAEVARGSWVKVAVTVAAAQEVWLEVPTVGVPKVG